MTAQTQVSPGSKSFLQKWGPPLGLCLTLFMVTYNVTLLPAIMPRVVRDLDSSMGYIQAALVLLSLVRASFAPTTANLIQRFGRKRIFLVGLGLFSLGILGAALSSSMGAFVTYYALLSGLGAVPLLVAPRDLIFKIYDDQAERLAFTALALFSSIGGIIGALLGGYLASNFGWRWAFAPNLLLVLTILGLIQFLPEVITVSRLPIDWVGGLLSFMGLGFTLLGVSLSGEFGWWEAKQTFSIWGVIIPPFSLSIVPPLIAAGLICFGFFLYWKRQQNLDHHVSLLQVGLFAHRPFLWGTAIATFHTLLTTGLQFNLYQFIPAVFGFNPFRTAIMVLPFPIMSVITLMVYVKNATRWPSKRCVQIGLAVFSTGVFFLYQSIRPGMTANAMLLPLIVMGIGSGLFVIPINLLAVAGLATGDRPEAAAIYTPFQNLGSALGRAILGTLLITLASVKIVDKVITELAADVTPEQRVQGIQQIQQVIQTFSREERREFWNQLPAQIRPALDGILNAAAFESTQLVILVIFGLSILCYWVAVWFTRSRPTS